MFAIQKAKAGKGLEATTIESQKPKDNEVRIKVTHAGVCGTDMHIYQWDDWSQKRVKPPLILGHEFVGEIVELGADVYGYQVGQRVSAEGHIVCGVCTLCKTGRAHLCKDTVIIGVDRQGAFCNEINMPAPNLWPVSSKISDAHAAIFDPLGNAMHTVMAFPPSGEHVMISGAGAIGLAAVAMAKANGARKVTVVEPSEHKRQVAQKLGADVTIDPFNTDVVATVADDKPTILLEMSGNEKALETGLKSLLEGGKVALLGIPPKAVTINLAELVIFKGLTLQGIVGRKMYETWYQVDHFLQNHPEAVDELVTHILPAQDFQKAFDLLEAGEAIKIVLQFAE